MNSVHPEGRKCRVILLIAGSDNKSDLQNYLRRR